jgi:acetyl-CoA C-acetyltransferase
MASVILGAARTPFAKAGGGLAAVTAVTLGQVAGRAALERAGVSPEQVEYVVYGQVVQAGAGHIPSRQVSLGIGIPEAVGSDTVNKVCASGLRAIALADLLVRAADRKVVLAGGMESMSNAPYLLPNARYGYRFGDGAVLDSMIQDGLRDPWSGRQMYEQASAVADELGLRREELDAWALRSHERAVAAGDEGRHGAEIVPVEVPGRRGETTLVEHDEGPRRDTTAERLAALRPLVADHPTHTAGNSPGVTDGAAAVVVADEAWARAQGLRPLARILATGETANRHDSLARVPAAAARIALERARIAPGDVARFEINEAFASVACNSARELGADPAIVNADGGAVALGHPVGASGARLVVTLLRQLAETGGIGVAAICSGGGQGDAMVLEVLGRDA